MEKERGWKRTDAKDDLVDVHRGEVDEEEGEICDEEREAQNHADPLLQTLT